MKRDPIYGIMAEFASAQALLDAAKRTHEAGYQKMDAYSPFPIEAGGRNRFPSRRSSAGGFDWRYYRRTHRLPDAILDVRRGLSAQHRRKAAALLPAFIVITFEMTILFAGVSAVLGMLALKAYLCRIILFSTCRALRWLRKIDFPDRVFLRSQIRSGKHAGFLESLAPRSISEVPS